MLSPHRYFFPTTRNLNWQHLQLMFCFLCEEGVIKANVKPTLDFVFSFPLHIYKYGTPGSNSSCQCIDILLLNSGGGLGTTNRATCINSFHHYWGEITFYLYFKTLLCSVYVPQSYVLWKETKLQRNHRSQCYIKYQNHIKGQRDRQGRKINLLI